MFHTGDFVEWNSGSMPVDDIEMQYGDFTQTKQSGIVLQISEDQKIALIAITGYKCEVEFVEHSVKDLTQTDLVMWFKKVKLGKIVMYKCYTSLWKHETKKVCEILEELKVICPAATTR